MAEPARDIKQGALDEVMGWMEGRFDGSIGSVAVAASRMVVKKGYISGGLWDEIGARTLHTIFRERMTAKRRRGLSLRTREGEATSRTDEEIAALEKSFPFYINERWYQLFDMTKEDVEQVAAYYADLAAGNAFECDFLTAVADELSEGELVRDKFNYEGLLKIREEVARRK